MQLLMLPAIHNASPREVTREVRLASEPFAAARDSSQAWGAGKASPRGKFGGTGGPGGSTSGFKVHFHLAGPDGEDLTDFEAVQLRQLRRREAMVRQAAGDVAASQAEAGNNAPASPQARGVSKKPKSGSGKLDPMAEAQQPPTFCGTQGSSVSNSGSWLDSRCFQPKSYSKAGRLNQRELGSKTSQGMKDLSEGERFILKRCKDGFLKRYGTLHSAFKKLDFNSSTTLSLSEFQDRTASLMKKADAKIFYRLIGKNGDHAVTPEELITILESV